MAAGMDGGSFVIALVVLVIAVLIGLFLFFEVFGWAPSGGGSSSAH